MKQNKECMGDSDGREMKEFELGGEWGLLNPYQKAAVTDDSPSCLVNANVGSGKTTVLIEKIRYLHEKKGVSCREMMVLTFTNKAAGEIKERFMKSYPDVAEEDMELFGTFHSVALKLLKKRLPVEKLGYTAGFSVMEPSEELDLALDLIAEHKLKIKYKNRLKKRLEQAAMQVTESAADLAAGNSVGVVNRYQDDFGRLVELLAETKIRQNKMVFSDLILCAGYLLKENPLDLKWIIIDEVQDCDRLQLELIDCLKGEDTRLFAVGDPNQVIYSWRGSVFNVFFTLKNRYQARELSLPVNYRSCTSILEAAKCFQQNGSALMGTRKSGDRISVKRHYNAFQEACYLADRIGELHGTGVPFHEVAVLYRLQSQSQVLEDVFEKQGIPYETAEKLRPQDIPVLCWLMRLLRFAVNKKDTASGQFVLAKAGMSEKEARRVIGEQDQEKSELLRKCMAFDVESRRLETPEELYQYFDLDKYIMPNSASYQADKGYADLLFYKIFDYVGEQKVPLFEGISDFLNSSALYGAELFARPKDDLQTLDIREGKVKLMTLHASKGMEFSHVFIIGVNYGLIPLRAKNMEEDDEERRLFFVGMTRAKDYLELSFYTNPDYYGVAPGESRYLQMIPGRLVQKEEVDGSVDLQDLKRQVQAEKNAQRSEEWKSQELDGKNAREPETRKQDLPVHGESTEKEDDRTSGQAGRVSHGKYGVGRVIAEDDLMIIVEFEGYGVKEFLKAFSELTVVEENRQ